MRVLSEEIGPRLAGSEDEQAAIAYTRRELERYGYDVEVQSFVVSGPETLRPAGLSGDGVGEIVAISLQGAGAGEVSGALVDAGTGNAAEFPAGATGAVVLVQRLDVPFVDMVRRAREAGAIGVVIANKEPGHFLGRIAPPSELPVVAIDQAGGEALRDALALGPLTVSLSVGDLADITAYNIIARPPSGVCRTVSGGHVDSVPWAPGANDNASGSGLVLELARASAVAGLSGHCFALWGAEELGLLGSLHFVESLPSAERDAIEAYYNYDVVAGADPPLVAGSRALTERAEELSPVAIQVSLDARELGSDHISFLDFGIPAIMVTTPSFDLIHTPQDTLSNLDLDFLDEVAALAFSFLTESDGGALPTP